MKVYLAWIGSYSDKRVVGVYSDEATALRVAKAIDSEDHRTQEVEVDAGPKPPEEDGLQLWWAITRDDGIAVDDCYRGLSLYGALADRPQIGEVVSAYVDGEAPWVVHVYAREEAHATKIAADKFREHVALRGSGGRA
jgi:hypothetical protein